MKTRPLNSDALWKSVMMKSDENRTPTVPKKNMILPNVNSLTGCYKEPVPSLHEEILTSSAKMSKDYWYGVELRKLFYRQNRTQDETLHRLYNNIYVKNIRWLT